MSDDEVKPWKNQNNEDRMAGILQGLQTGIAELAKASRSQTETPSSLRNDMLFQPDSKTALETEGDFNLNTAVDDLLDLGNADT